MYKQKEEENKEVPVIHQVIGTESEMKSFTVNGMWFVENKP